MLYFPKRIHITCNYYIILYDELYPNNKRDKSNINAIRQAEKDDIPIIGICRGFQLLDVYNGGKLFQHSVGHVPRVTVRTYEGGFNGCYSCHHQIIDEEHTAGKILGYSDTPEITVFSIEGSEKKLMRRVPQIVYWEKQKHFGVQFHPEWAGESHKINAWLRLFIKNKFDLENVL